MSAYKLKQIEKSHKLLFYAAWSNARIQRLYYDKESFCETDLVHAFRWIDTVQGHDFWERKHDYLKHLFAED